MTDEELLALWHEGDEQGFSGLFQRYSQKVLAFITSMLGDFHRSEELTQEVFVRVFTQSTQFEPRAKLSTWMFQIARNLTLNELRDRRRHGEVTLEDHTKDVREASPSSPAAHLDAGEIRTQLERAVAQLSEEQRAVFMLKHEENLRYEQIAEILGCPEVTVKSRMYAAVRQLRAALGGVQ